MKLFFRARPSALALAAVLVLASPAAWAQPDPSLADVALPRLQDMVGSCDLQAAQARPPSLMQAFCEAAADELGRRAFDGDRARLLAWWRERRGALQAPAKAGPPQPSAALSSVTPAQLQSAYLQCERQAQAAALDSATAATCSMIYEALKQRVFGGDFDRLLAWWRQQQAQPAAQAGATASEVPPL
jgi:hypothetical protein